MKIVLSYASEDRKLAEEIQLALVSVGHHVFFDKTSLPPGGDYRSQIQSEVVDSDILVFLISPDSIAQGSYALTELKYARVKWPHPKDTVLPVLLRATTWDAIPPYLKSVTILEPEGNAAAEVVGAVVSLNEKKRTANGRTNLGTRMWLVIAGLAGASGVTSILNWSNFFGPSPSPPSTSTPQQRVVPNPRPPDTLSPRQDSRTLSSLQELRDAAARFGSNEYVADEESVSITSYPSLVDVVLFPDGKVTTEPLIGLAPGVSLDLRFKDAVVGFGMYHKQALYPSNFSIYFRGGTQKVFAGRDYWPKTGFVAEVSEDPIDRVIIQPQANGSLTITGIYIFAKGRHERVLRRE